MISSVYSYYLSQYGNKSNSKYDSHTRTQLKNTYSKVVKINSQTPVYKLDLSTAAQKYAIDLKEHARALENITEDLSDGADGTMTFKKSAVSSNASAVNASYITDFGAASDDESFDINVKQLACSQLNTGNYLQPRSKHIKPGEYSFDLSINDVIYEFQFKVDNSETTNNIQNKIARLINRSNIGLTANIKEDSLGNTAINIESESTGINGTTPVIFSIKSDDANNQPLIDTLGLDRENDTHIAYGTIVSELKEVSRSYKEARMALDVGKIFSPEKDVIAYSSLGIGRLIYQLPIPLCKMFIKEIFGGKSPDDFDEETLVTIDKFFENSLNVSETSRQLYIHRNTLVYRLDKLQKSTGLDLRVFEDAITFKIALMVVRYMKYMETLEY